MTAGARSAVSGTVDAALERLHRRLPAEFSLLHAPVADHTDSLYPEELALVMRAVDKRRREFSTGRWLARAGMLRMGIPVGPVSSGELREPLWPPGMIGSLSHSGNTCAFVGAPTSRYLGVGLDLELSAPPKAELANLILCPAEPPGWRDPGLLRLVFSAKEALYKCLHPVVRTFFDFHDVHLQLDFAAGAFSARPHGTAVNPVLLERGQGLFEFWDGGALTLFTLPADDNAVADAAGKTTRTRP